MLEHIIKNEDIGYLRLLLDMINSDKDEKKNKNQNKIININQENAIVVENLVDFIFNTLSEDYNSDYLFE